jgi:hypothetical protein
MSAQNMGARCDVYDRFHVKEQGGCHERDS